jgi:hypothetical protein
MTLRCLCVAKLAAASALSPPPTLPPYCRCCRSHATAAAALSPSPPVALPTRLPQCCKHCQAAKLAANSALLPLSLLR